jgi:predicted ATPase
MEITLKNYRAFRSATLRLSPLTVIVGPNASGKSSLVDALDPSWVLTERDVTLRDSQWTVEVMRVKGSQQWNSVWKGGNFFRPEQPPFRFQKLHLDVSAMRKENLSREDPQLASDGSNLTNAFDTLTRNQQGELAQRYCELVPVFSDVNVRPLHGGNQRLVFQDRWNSALWYEPTDVSDGSLLSLAVMLLAYQRHNPDLIAIEEPERGLHPYLIRELLDRLRLLGSSMQDSPAIRIVLMTSSAEVVEYARPEEVRLLNRQPDGTVKIAEIPHANAHWQQAFETYGRSLGSMWLAGGLGGVP